MSTSNPYQPPSGPASVPVASGPPPGPSLDFGRAMSFFFQDPRWLSKILIGSLFTVLSMFVIGGVFLSGYAARLIRNASKGQAQPLPEWDDLGGMFAEGLSVIGAYFLHVIPAVLLMAVAVVPAAVLGESDGEPGPIVLVVFVSLAGVMTLLMFGILAYFPAAVTRLAIEERFGAAFEVGKNWAFLHRNLSNYILAIVVFMVANFVSQLGVLLFCVGIFPASFWGLCAGAYALGEVAYRDPERR